MNSSRRATAIRVLGWLARWYLGSLFLLACYHKILAPGTFAIDVATYQVLPLWLVNITAVVLPWVELGAGLLLILGWKVRAAALLVSLMLLSFMGALAFALWLGLDMSCGCFASQGAEHDPISGWTMVRDGAWLAGSLFILFFDTDPIGLPSLLAGRRRGHEH